MDEIIPKNRVQREEIKNFKKSVVNHVQNLRATKHSV
jgi:hypothetical protein